MHSGKAAGRSDLIETNIAKIPGQTIKCLELSGSRTYYIVLLSEKG
jgi:hypothetical protein